MATISNGQGRGGPSGIGCMTQSWACRRGSATSTPPRTPGRGRELTDTRPCPTAGVTELDGPVLGAGLIDPTTESLEELVALLGPRGIFCHHLLE